MTGNLVQGKSFSQSFTQVDGIQILISGAAGALTSGASVIVPKNVVGKVAKEVATTTVDVVESFAKQYNEGSMQGKSFTESVFLKQTASEVVTNKIGGKLMDNVNANGIKTAEKKLDRAQRIAANDVTSSGRANVVKTAETNAVIANGSKQVAFGPAGNTIQVISNTLILAPSISRNYYRNVSTPAVDNTYLKKPLIRL